MRQRKKNAKTHTHTQEDTWSPNACLITVDLVLVLVHSGEGLPDGYGDDVRHDSHQEALNGQITAVGGEAANAVYLQKDKKNNNMKTEGNENFKRIAVFGRSHGA